MRRLSRIGSWQHSGRLVVAIVVGSIIAIIAWEVIGMLDGL